jgi:tetratricopeptide (TPR) repeat protein
MLLLAATILVYVGVARSGFLNYDDGLYLTGNRVVTTGLNPTSLRWAFGSLGYAANWHPVTWVSHLVDVELFGLRPGAHHLVSLAIHLVNIVLLLLLLWRLTGSRWMAVAVAAFFALHPQNVQSVAWLAERKNVLSTMLMLAAFLAWLGHLERPAGRRVTLWSTALLLFGLSLMAKPMPVTLPVLLLLADWWPLGRHRGGVGPGRLLAEKVPFFILSAASAAVTLVAQGRGEAIMGVGDYPVGWRIATAVVGAATYLRRLVWPDDLAVFHPMPHGWPAQTVLAAALLLGALALLAWRSRRRFPAGLAGLGWYLVALLPVIGLVQVGEQSTADRYAYLPTIGIFVAVAALWRRWAERGIVARPLAAAVFLAALTLMGARTAREVTYWRDSTTLFRRALEKTRENWLAHGNLGAALFEKGDRAQALLHQREVVRLRPGFARGRAALARTLAAEGALVEAAAEYQQAIRLEPGLVDAAVGLAQVMEEMGLEQETDNYFRWMIDSRVGDERVLFAWADFLLRRGRTREAADRYRRGLEANPLNAVVRNTYATALARLGMTGEAETEFRRAVGLNAGLIEPRRNLALLLEQTGRPAEALRLYREVLRLEPMDRVAAEGVERLTGGDGRP